MASKLLIPSVVAIGALLAVITPFLRESNAIFNVLHDFSKYTPHLTQLNATCSHQHPTLLTGCEDMQLVGDSIYTACLTDFRNRNKYWPHYSRQPRPWSGDKLFRWDLPTDTVVELSLQNYPYPATAEHRSFHGIDVNVLPNGDVSIYAVNHLRNESVIDKFVHTPGTAFATHVLRIPTDAEGAARLPNAIFALPEKDGEAAMFVTNDHYYDDGWMRMVEEAGRRPWAWVSYYSTSTGWKKVLSNMRGANGITGEKEVQNRRVYVSEIMGGAIRVLEPTAAEGELREIQRVKVDMLGDNIGRFGDDLYITGPAKGMAVDHFQAEPEAAKDGPGMVVKRINTKQLGGGFFGGGYTADPIVETLIVDGGLVANMTTTSVFRPYPVEAPAAGEGEGEGEDEMEEKPLGKPKGDLFITGLQHRGIMKCTNFE